MSKKRYQTIQNDLELLSETKLPLDRLIAIYYRQSTDAQIGNISTAIQTVDMAALLERYGWQEEQIILIDADAGISGTTKIDERPGMSKLFNLIIKKEIGAVACQDEDRLFRDITQIQVNIFIEACRAARVLVITPSMTYDFAHAQMGAFHMRQFRFKSEMAAEYINSVVLGKLHAAKRRLALEGRWAGSPVAVGYMVDLRRNLPGGIPNENWKRFAVFEPYAAVVREYFRLFLSCSGNVARTLRDIRNNGPYFPNPNECFPPDGYKVHYKIRKNADGWCPSSKQTLIQMFTNAIYIGHWIVKDTIVQWNNHPVIVDNDTFFRAFNYLSEHMLDGKRNPNYHPRKVHSRPSLEEDRPETPPLCSGLIISKVQDEWRSVGTHWMKWKGYYCYVLTTSDGYASPLWYKKSSYFDAAISGFFLEKLQTTFDSAAWELAVDTLVGELEQQREGKESQLERLETVMENLLASLSSLNTPDMIREVERRYQEAKAEHIRLRQLLDGNSPETTNIKKIRDLAGSFIHALENWDAMPAEEKREIFQLFIERIEADPKENEALNVAVYWKDGSTNNFVLSRQSAQGITWLPHEIEHLISLVEFGSDQVEIARAFPNRRWKDIAYKYRSTTRNPLVFRPRNYVKKHETYLDYAERVGFDGSLSMTSDVSSPTS